MRNGQLIRKEKCYKFNSIGTTGQMVWFQMTGSYIVFMKRYLCGIDYHVASGEILVTCLMVGLGPHLSRPI